LALKISDTGIERQDCRPYGRKGKHLTCSIFNKVCGSGLNEFVDPEPEFGSRVKKMKREKIKFLVYLLSFLT
jgi:hypothetical protein